MVVIKNQRPLRGIGLLVFLSLIVEYLVMKRKSNLKMKTPYLCKRVLLRTEVHVQVDG